MSNVTGTARNAVTGDEIKSKVSTKEYEDNFDRIFRKNKVDKSKPSSNQLAECPNYPEPCFCTGACKPEWNEKRVDVIGSNGNDGEVYHWLHKHGHRPKGGSSPTYKSWNAMKNRCKNKQNENYGGKGITYDSRWEDFVNFLTDMGERPQGCSLDRINVHGNYSKENCRWATSAEQSRNKINTISVTIKGRTQCLLDWSKEYSIPTTTIYRRYKKGLVGEELIKPALHHYDIYEKIERDYNEGT